MRSMSKAQARKRLEECDVKLTNLYFNGKKHLTQGELKKIIDMITQCGRIVERLR